MHYRHHVVKRCIVTELLMDNISLTFASLKVALAAQVWPTTLRITGIGEHGRVHKHLLVNYSISTALTVAENLCTLLTPGLITAS